MGEPESRVGVVQGAVHGKGNNPANCKGLTNFEAAFENGCFDGLFSESIGAADPGSGLGPACSASASDDVINFQAIDRNRDGTPIPPHNTQPGPITSRCSRSGTTSQWRSQTR